MSTSTRPHRFLALILFLATLAGCAPANYYDDLSTTNDANITRYYDEDAGVVCWLYQGHGISCLPVTETMLKPWLDR